MSKRTKIIIGLLIALSSLTVIVALANQVANTIYMPAVYLNYPPSTASPPRNVAITGFHPSYDPQDDYVMLKNQTGATIDMTGWWLKAENQSGRYDFPVDFILNAGNSVNVRTGIGADTLTDLYIGGSESLWTKANNCAYLRYSDGTLLDKECVN